MMNLYLQFSIQLRMAYMDLNVQERLLNLITHLLNTYKKSEWIQ